MLGIKSITNQSLSARECLPLLWDKIKDIKQLKADDEELLMYVPEGEENAAKITLENNEQINVWKVKSANKKLTLKWKPHTLNIDTILNATKLGFTSLTIPSLSAKECLPIFWDNIKGNIHRF